MTTVHTPRGVLAPPAGPSNMPAPDPDAPCCYGSAEGEGCTCWTAVVEPVPVLEVQEGPHLVAGVMCGDCAYRPGSPERQEQGGDPPDYSLRQRFYCHTGMPLAVAYEHPQVPGPIPCPTTDDFRPLIRDGQPWQADGRPAVLCAGWAARNGVKAPRVKA